MKKYIICFVILMMSAPVFAQEGFMELIRSEVRTNKIAVFMVTMDLTRREEKKFWPLYRKYEKEMSRIFDMRFELIRDYAENMETMTDEKADDLASRALLIDALRQDLREDAYFILSDELSPTIAARFLQVDKQINLLIDLEIIQEIPLITKADTEEAQKLKRKYK